MRRLSMLHLLFRNTGKLYYFPSIIALVFTPVLAYRYHTMLLDTASEFLLICRLTQLLLPLLVVWWLYFSMREQMDGNLREIMSVYQSGFLSSLLDFLLILLWHALHMAITMLILSFWFPYMWMLYLHLLIQSLFFSGLFYLASELCRSSAFGFFIVLTYYFVSAFFSNGTALNKISIFLTDTLLTDWIDLHPDCIVAVIGIFSSVLGAWLTGRKKF